MSLGVIDPNQHTHGVPPRRSSTTRRIPLLTSRRSSTDRRIPPAHFAPVFDHPPHPLPHLPACLHPPPHPPGSLRAGLRPPAAYPLLTSRRSSTTAACPRGISAPVFDRPPHARGVSPRRSSTDHRMPPAQVAPV